MTLMFQTKHYSPNGLFITEVKKDLLLRKQIPQAVAEMFASAKELKYVLVV